MKITQEKLYQAIGLIKEGKSVREAALILEFSEGGLKKRLLKNSDYKLYSERGNGFSNYCLLDTYLDESLSAYKFETVLREYTGKGFVRNNPFADLTLESTQYWLGILATDGCVRDNGIIKLISIDKELIENFIKFLGSKTIISSTVPVKGAIQYYCSFQNKQVALYLNDLGLTSRKTFTLDMKIPITFPFMRGVIDGDGCVHVRCISCTCVSIVTASSLFANQIKDFLERNGIRSYIYTNKNLYEVKISSINNVYNLYRYLYYKSSFHLQRKKDKYKPMLDKYNQIIQDFTDAPLLSN